MAVLGGSRDILCLCFCVAVHFIYRYRRRALLPYPPGLPRWPLIGNALSLPMTYMHVFYKDLGEKLGSKIMYLDALGLPIVVLNDAGMARDLLEKRSALYSSRPYLPMITDIVKMDYVLGVMPYGDVWRNHRRLFQQYFSPRTLHRDAEKEVDWVRRRLLPNLYRAPQKIHKHMQSCIGGFAMAATYGLPGKLEDHEKIAELAEVAFAAAAQAAAPGKYLVDVMPVLKYIPAWMPGASFKRLGLQWRALLITVMDEPFQATLKAIEDGTARPSFVSESLEQHSHRPDFELQVQHIKQAATSIYSAASETTVSACMTFVLAMLTHPDIQRKAQQEIDSVIGHERLPDFSDQMKLPYLSAILKEVFRWNPLVPMGVPHLSTAEDAYKGYYIPKGSIVIANAYAMLHDDEVFPNPKEFKPERFFKDGKVSTDLPDPEFYATFGFGRRICPGSHLGRSMLYIIAASILSVFDISPELDAEGNPIRVVPEFLTGSIVSEPRHFACKLTPRAGKNVEKLLRDYVSE